MAESFFKRMLNKIFNKKTEDQIIDDDDLFSGVYKEPITPMPEHDVKPKQYTTDYKNPTSVGIHIKSLQSELISFYFDMTLVSALGDDSFTLPHPYKVLHTRKYSKQEASTLEEENFETYDAQAKKNLPACKKLEREVLLRNILTDEIRKNYPDFLKNAQGKISPENLATYRTQKIKLKQTLLKSAIYTENTNLKNLLLTYQDNLASLIDTKDFSTACRIEDSFVKQELEKYIEIFHKLPLEEKERINGIKITYTDHKEYSPIQLAHKYVEMLDKRLSTHAQIDALYDKMSTVKTVNFNINNSNPEINAEENVQQIHFVAEDTIPNDDEEEK